MKELMFHISVPLLEKQSKEYLTRKLLNALESTDLNATLYGDEPELIELHADRNGVQTEMKHWAVKHLAISLVESLGDAKNYVEMNLSHPETGPLRVIIERGQRPGAGQLRSEAQRLLETLVKAISAKEDNPDMWRAHERAQQWIVEHPLP